MKNSVKWTPDRLRALKGKRRFACLTAYDFATARLVDEAELPVVLVGDSLGMTVLGYETTLPVTMEQMLHHTVANAGRFLKEAGADAVKIEGGRLRTETVRALVGNGIPVMGHLGLTPQSVRAMGGYKVQGRTAAAARALKSDAKALEAAGVFAIVLEGIPAPLARAITAAVGVPTIGIGAGPGCDGQVLVVNDLLGLSGDFTPRFVKRYAELGATMARAFAAYRDDVESGRFPGKEHCY